MSHRLRPRRRRALHSTSAEVIAVVAVLSPSGSLVVNCPYCHHQHIHGGGAAVPGERLPFQSHCLDRSLAYELIVTAPAANPARAAEQLSATSSSEAPLASATAADSAELLRIPRPSCVGSR